MKRRSGEKRAPTQRSEMRKINLWSFRERALLCNFAAFLCLFSPKLHSLLPKDDILDPSGHNMTFSSRACCSLVVIAAFSLQTQEHLMSSQSGITDAVLAFGFQYQHHNFNSCVKRTSLTNINMFNVCKRQSSRNCCIRVGPRRF